MFPPSQPTLKIASVGGLSAPAQPKGSFQEEPDIIIPTTQTNPTNVALEASGIPLGSVIRVTLIPENGDLISVQSTPLSGTVAASTATASISIPNGISILYASATIELPSTGAKAMFINGEQVERIELNSTFGGKTEVTYILKSGKKYLSNK